MYRLEDGLKTAFVLFLLALVVIEILGWIFVFFNWQVGLASILIPIALSVAAGYSVVYRVPAVFIGVPESLIVGRFRDERFDECGCSVPIAKAKAEGLDLKWPWHKIHLLGREIQTHKIDNQRYDIKNGAVMVSGIVQRRTSSLCAYRKLAISPDDVDQGMSAVIDQVLVRDLIQCELEEALQLKETLRQRIAEAFDRQAEVTDPNDPSVKIGRTLNGQPVSVSQHRFGDEIVSVNIDRIDPTEELAAARGAVQVEELKKKQTEKKMQRYEHIKTELKKMFPDLSDEKIGEKLELVEGLSTKEKKLYGISDLDEVSNVVAGLASIFRPGGN